MRNRLIVTLLLTTLLLSACGASTASFAGTYTYQNNGTPAEIVRVTNTGDTWTIQAKSGNTWGDAQTLHPATDMEKATLFGADGQQRVEAGLVNPNVAIFRIKPGSVIKGKTYQTPYVVVYILGIIPVEQLPQH